MTMCAFCLFQDIYFSFRPLTLVFFFDRMKILLVFSPFDSTYTLNRLWVSFLLSKVEKIQFGKKIALYSAATLNFLFLLQHFHQNCIYLFIITASNFVCRDKITFSLYMCVYTALVHMAYWSCNPFIESIALGASLSLLEPIGLLHINYFPGWVPAQ